MREHLTPEEHARLVALGERFPGLRDPDLQRRLAVHLASLPPDNVTFLPATGPGPQTMSNENYPSNQPRKPALDATVYDVQEVAYLLNLSVATIRRYCADGALPAVKFAGKRYRISKNDLESFWQAQGGKSLFG
jgi:excisionase family DNA binding protein